MSETYDQTGVDSVPVEATPIESILDGGAADVPASSQEPDFQDSYDRRDTPNVPLTALKRERERRKKMDSRVRELEAEIERFNNQKYGFDDDEPIEQQAEQSGYSAEAEWPNDDAFARKYNDSLIDFVAKHGRDRVAAIDAVLPRLNPAQQQEMMGLVGSAKNPVEAVQQYLHQHGLLDSGFKALSIEDVLKSKGKQPETDTSAIDQRLATLDQRERSIAAAEKRTAYNASRTEFVAEHGKAKYAELDAASMSLMQSGHPVAADFAAAVQASPDPVTTAAELLTHLGMWSSADAPRMQPVYPSNLAAARNVGPRRGPAYAGPPSLDDIFGGRSKGKGA